MKRLMQLLRDNAGKERQPLALARNEAEPSSATLYIYDVIDAYWGIGAQEVVKLVAGLSADTTLHVRINSPGGDVFEARAIAASLQQHQGPVVAHIDGLAASAATTVAMAAGEIEIADGGFFMIHNAWSIVIGNKDDMTEMAGLLDKIDGAIAADYTKRTKKSQDQVNAWMAAETWFTAQEAVDNGFADRLAQPGGKGGSSNASTKAFNLKAFSNTPAALLQTSARKATEPDAAAVRARNERRLQLLEIA